MKIAVICGGLSNERDVSLSSGTGIARALRGQGHRVLLADLFLGMEHVPEDLDTLFTDHAAEADGKETDQAGEPADDPIVRAAIEFFDEWIIEANTPDASQGLTLTRPGRDQICIDRSGQKCVFLTAHKDGLFYYTGDNVEQGYTQPWEKIILLCDVMGFYGPNRWYIRTHMEKLYKRIKPICWVANEPLYQEALRFVDDWMGIDFEPGWKPSSPERGVLLWKQDVGNLIVTLKPEGMKFNYLETDENVPWSHFQNGNLRFFNGCFLNDCKLVESKPLSPFEYFLKELHIRLRGKAIWKPTGPEKAGAVGHLPDSRKKDIEDFVVQNRKAWDLGFDFSRERETTFRLYLRIPDDVPILLARMDSTLFKMNFGKDGWAITRDGILAHGTNSKAYSWESFAGPFSGVYGLTNIVTYKKEEENEELLDFFLALRTYVRGLMGMD